MMRADLPGDEQARRARRAEEAVEGIDVLLVEDDPGDVLMTKEAFEERHIADRLHVVGDGVLAMQFLRRTDEFNGAPRPGLILLDLNLPRRNGLEVLAELKADQELRSIPVVVLTSSQSEQDILRSYSLHANAFETKPLEFERFLDAVRQIDSFFLALAKLPNEALARPALASTPEHRGASRHEARVVLPFLFVASPGSGLSPWCAARIPRAGRARC